jgi:hypothetical protein
MYPRLTQVVTRLSLPGTEEVKLIMALLPSSTVWPVTAPIAPLLDTVTLDQCDHKMVFGALPLLLKSIVVTF